MNEARTTPKLAAATIPENRALYKRKIDALVYELYGLTEAEIEIVENAVT